MTRIVNAIKQRFRTISCVVSDFSSLKNCEGLRMTILFTGDLGFIGSAVLRRLLATTDAVVVNIGLWRG